MTTITRFTKEQLIKRLEEQQSSARYALSFVQDSEILRDIEMDLRIIEIARASLEAEPVSFDALRDAVAEVSGGAAMEWSDIYKGHQAVPFINFNSLARIVDKFRAAPPAPVVPDEVRNKLKAEGLADLLRDARDYAPLTSEQWETLTNNWHQTFVGLSGENDACRAAMLDNCATVESRNHAACSPKNGLKCAAVRQGAEPVSNRDELPVIGWLRSDYDSDDKRDPNAPLFMLGSNDPSETWGVKYLPLSGNSPVTPDGYVVVPKRLTAENGAKCLLVGEFSETKFINCTECFGDDECETCDGSGRIEISVPVSWTNIKAIWAKGVEHFAAAPKQETL